MTGIPPICPAICSASSLAPPTCPESSGITNDIKTGKVKYQPIPQYPSVSRDIALVMDESVPANDVCQKIIKSSNKLVKTTNIFDVYVGEHVEAGKKSVAINLTFQDDKKTLKEQEINEAMEKILKAVEKDFGAVLRG